MPRVDLFCLVSGVKRYDKKGCEQVRRIQALAVDRPRPGLSLGARLHAQGGDAGRVKDVQGVGVVV